MAERKPLDPAYKARREREMAAKIAERNAGGDDRGLVFYQCEHERLPRRTAAPAADVRTGARQGDEEKEPGQEKDPDKGTGEAEFASVADLGRVALSSETPVRRRGWWGPDWIEILDHGVGSVRLARVARGMAMLAEHERTRLAGKWTEGAVDPDRVLRAVPKFSRNGFAQEVQADVLDGIRSTTSIGYRVHAAQLEAVDEDNVETWRFIDWEPLEASWEVIPADLAVGVGRSAVANDPARNQPADAARGEHMAEDPKAGPAGRTDGGTPAPAVPVPSVEVIRSEERTRTQHLRNLGKAHALPEARVEKWISEGTSFADAAREIVTERAANPPKPTTAPAQSTRNLLGLTDQEARNYSLRAAIMQAVEVRAPGQGDPAGFEMEVSRALEKHIPEKYQARGGIFVPTGILTRAGSLDAATLEVLRPLLASARQFRDAIQTRDGLDTGTSTKGAEAVYSEFRGFIELLRARAMVLQLGATYLPGLVGNASFVKQTAAATAEWLAENPGSDQAITELALVLVTLSPKTLMASTYYTRQLLRQAALSVDALVEADLVAIHARGIDRAGIHGSGSGDNQPEGVYVASGVNAVAFAGAISYAKVIEMETAIADADADVDGMAYLTTPGIRGVAKQTETFPDVSGAPIWTGGVRDGEMNGYKAAASTQVRTDLGATPTPTPSEHGLVFGAWGEMLVGEWGMLELIVDPFSGKKQGIIEVSSFQMADVQFRHAEAFAKATGLTLA
jgi:HK97 family phage major capsid protein